MNPTELYNIKFYCPPMSYKLWHGNTYDYEIPPDVMPQYRDSVKKAIDNAPYFIRVKHPNVVGIAPDVEVIDGELIGILKVTADAELSQEDMVYLQDSLTDRISSWSIYFEGQEIKTSGGDLYIRFYDSNEPILSETAFNNRVYVNQHPSDFNSAKFYFNDDTGQVAMVYYNPDSSAGGQLVENNISSDLLKEAFDKCKTYEDFWNRLNERARQYLTDIDTPDFADMAKRFVEEPCDCAGEDLETMNMMRDWMSGQCAEPEQSQGMNM